MLQRRASVGDRVWVRKGNGVNTQIHKHELKCIIHMHEIENERTKIFLN